MSELLAATGTGLYKSFLPFAAKISAAKRAVQLQRQLFQFKARALVGCALNHRFKTELKRLGHYSGKCAILDVYNLKTCATLTGDFLFRHLQQTLCNGHFMHGVILAQTPGNVKPGRHSCHSA